ncbi:MAG TPA: NAD+ synthase [Alphaproteobacteria bacterium]|nr:NAD+ synthase [Alphaproteobacteria bacterium]
MADTLSLYLAQVDPTVGDIAGNLARLTEAHKAAGRAGADLMVAAELAICGYPPEDLVMKPAFLRAVADGIEKLAMETATGPAILVGAPIAESGRRYNAVLLLENGRVAAIRTKRDLPNYGVFDEKRVFDSGPLPEPIPFRGLKLGAMVCEDMWTPDVTKALAAGGAEVLIVVNGSPYETDKLGERVALARDRVSESGLPLVYLNQVGGQDELVFDGASFAMAGDGSVAVGLPSFREAEALVRLTRANGKLAPERGEVAEPLHPLAAIYLAMMTGLRDYVNKNRFPGVLIGLSGGIDSALTAAVAADALGASRVRCVMMPSPYTSTESLEDATQVAAALGVKLDTIPIAPAMKAFGEMLAPAFAGANADTTEENIQARSRGIALMALSNKFGHMVVSTGNKSEMSVGYATLYGDMCGGYSVLKDVYKTTVFELCRWRNAHKPEGALGPSGLVIGERIITKPPTAELKPNQKDEDSLPPYAVLDQILREMIEGEKGPDEIVALGFDAATVARVWRMVNVAEYKRRQAPPGVKITRRSFGRDRRYPIVNGFSPSFERSFKP